MLHALPPHPVRPLRCRGGVDVTWRGSVSEPVPLFVETHSAQVRRAEIDKLRIWAEESGALMKTNEVKLAQVRPRSYL